MKIIGSQLSATQKQEVLRTFVHRWTHENAKQTYGGRCPGCVQASRNGEIRTGPKNERVWTVEEWHAYHVPLISDAEWLAQHAFEFTKAGHLSNRVSHCEPAYMAG